MTMPCIEPAPRAGIREARHIVKASHRQRPRTPKPITYSPDDPIAMLAATIAKRIFVNRKNWGCGSWLLGTRDGRVFVLKETDTTTPALLQQHAGEIIGRYAANTASGSRVHCPKPDEVLEDLAAHFAEIGVAAAA